MNANDKLRQLEREKLTLETLIKDNPPEHPDWNIWHESYFEKCKEIADLKFEERNNH